MVVEKTLCHPFELLQIGEGPRATSPCVTGESRSFYHCCTCPRRSVRVLLNRLTNYSPFGTFVARPFFYKASIPWVFYRFFLSGSEEYSPFIKIASWVCLQHWLMCFPLIHDGLVLRRCFPLYTSGIPQLLHNRLQPF